MLIQCPVSGTMHDTKDGVAATVTAPHYLLTDSIPFSELEALVANHLGTLTPDLLHTLGIALLLKLPLETEPELATSQPERLSNFWLLNIPRMLPISRTLAAKTFNGLPTLRVTFETLPHLPHWLEELKTQLAYLRAPISEEAKRRNRESYKSSLLDDLLGGTGTAPVQTWSKEEKQSLMIRAIKGSPLTPKEQTAFPQLLADWADSEAPFPLATVRLASGKKTTTKGVWQSLITKAIREGSSYIDLISGEFTLDDLEDLEAHLLAGLGSSSLQSSYLFRKLAEAREVIAEFTQIPAPAAPAQPAELYSLPSPQPQGNLSIKERLAIKLANARRLNK